MAPLTGLIPDNAPLHSAATIASSGRTYHQELRGLIQPCRGVTGQE